MKLNLLKLNLLFILFPVVSCESFFDYKVKDISGQEIALSKYAGKVVLVVNVASECGYTDDHYKALVRMQKDLSATKHFQVLAFPSNEFGGQEPKSNEDILLFAKKNYNVNFPIFSKINVIKDKKDASPVWKFLQERSGVYPSWNFFKYLVDGKGEVAGGWGPQTKADELIPHIFPLIEKAIKTGEAPQRFDGRSTNEL